jgi:hypothetical protein
MDTTLERTDQPVITEEYLAAERARLDIERSKIALAWVGRPPSEMLLIQQRESAIERERYGRESEARTAANIAKFGRPPEPDLSDVFYKPGRRRFVKPPIDAEEAAKNLAEWRATLEVVRARVAADEAALRG